MTVKEAEADVALEKFVFEISSTLKNVDLPLEVILESESIYALADLTQHLRSCLIKINGYQSKHALSDSNKTFSLSIERLQGGYPSMDSKKEEDESIDWIPADQLQQQWKSITSLKTVPMDLFQVKHIFPSLFCKLLTYMFMNYFSLILLLWKQLLERVKSDVHRYGKRVDVFF